MSKYYTPEIEEFHVGFEYEYRGNWVPSGWDKHIVTDTATELEFDLTIIQKLYDTSYNSQKIEDTLRVKHLDREDIESLGFEVINETKDILFFRKHLPSKPNTNKKEDWWEIKLEVKGYRVQILQGHSWMRFIGTIKNKSELKRILKQIGI